MPQPSTAHRRPHLAPTPAPPPVPAALVAFGCDPAEEQLFRELAPRFGVAVTVTADPLTPASAARARGSRCVAVSHKTPVCARTLDALAAAGVGLVVTRSVGCDHVDVAHAASLGIAVETAPYAPDGVADFTVMLILMALRGAREQLRRAEAFDYRPASARGRELRDLTVGVIGAGRIGAAVAGRLRGFGCEVLVHDDALGPASVPLVTLLSRSDVVTLHVPLTDATHHLLDAGRLALLPRGAVVVNTGRGALIDTTALLAALDAGRIAAAALDVVEEEEQLFYAARYAGEVPETLRRLHAMPQVLLTGHTAYYTHGALRDTVAGALAACQEHARPRASAPAAPFAPGAALPATGSAGAAHLGPVGTTAPPAAGSSPQRRAQHPAPVPA